MVPSYVTHWSLVDGYQRFGGMCFLHIQWRKTTSAIGVGVLDCSETLTLIFQPTFCHITEDWRTEMV
jgi:hypothetical protein